jgi:hypothetical protein
MGDGMAETHNPIIYSLDVRLLGGAGEDQESNWGGANLGCDDVGDVRLM